MFRWFKSHERRDFKRAWDFLHSSRIVMNSAVETMRCIREPSMYCHDQQQELITAVILNARFLNNNLAIAVDKFSAWEVALTTANPEHVIKLRCMLINVKKNFDVARMHTEEINQWLEDDKVLASLYSRA